MNTKEQIAISNFFTIGINYKKTDAATRGQFAINSDQYENIIQLAAQFNVESLFVLSTCNRTEVYGFAQNPAQLINLLCTQTSGDAATFTSLAYIKNGQQAIEHLFNVGAGLDSQILGDYEIIGQLKQVVKFARERGAINCFLERLVNCVLQSSKSIKNETTLSGGTVSVSFAAVQYIRKNISFAGKKILLVGVGKIGRNTCKNLVDYLGTTAITLINRSEEKASALATELNLNYAPIDQLSTYIDSSDIILIATNAPEPAILRSHLANKGEKLIIDLSIPYNVEASAAGLPNVTLVNVDTLSKLKDETLQQREAETPKAKLIIEQHIADFIDWYQMRKHAPVLNAIKTRLNEIAMLHKYLAPAGTTTCPVMAAERRIQQVVNGVAQKMRTQNTRGCNYLEAINEYIGLSAT